MRLTHVQVQLFRNIVDSTAVAVQPDVTCLVGRNESGKSTFLHALYRLNPARPNARFDVLEHYPAWRERKDRMRGRPLEETTPVTATFELEAGDLAQLAERFGPNAMRSPTVVLTRNYGGATFYTFETDEAAVVADIVHHRSLPPMVADLAGTATTIAQLRELVGEFRSDGDAELLQAAALLDAQLAATLGDSTSVRQAIRDLLGKRLPTFFFFDDYATLSGRLPLRTLLTAPPETLSDEELTALSLLRMAGADDSYLLHAGYERRRREMEGVANALTEETLKYWSQNTGLRVLIDLAPGDAGHHRTTAEGDSDELQIRLWDARHFVSLPFDQRSSGFRWFFSFLAAFAQYDGTQAPVIILLDEPALGLHARAQQDFLRFINERLAVNGTQVLYTTHSPFMVEADHLERVRLVEDRGRDVGSIVTSDLRATDPATLSPVQAALGAQLAQALWGQTTPAADLLARFAALAGRISQAD